MELKILITLFAVLIIISVEGKKTGRSRSSGSGRGSSRKTNYNPQPAPTSFSYSQPSAQKPSLSGWQEQPAQKTKPTNTHSYPSSGTGLSGNKPKQTQTNQESIQRSSASNNLATQQGHTNNQPSHAYPSSTGLSGSPGNQVGYPQSPGSSLSGSGQPGNIQQHSGSSYPQQMGGRAPQAPPPYSEYRPGDNNRQYQGQNNYGNNYNHPQGPPPAYSNVGNYGGYGGHGYNAGYGQQMPGYFGNYGKGNGGVSRAGSALTGVGIAGAGIGTVLTGLALWNLARSTGHNHHTVIYDNRGQPVAVAPANDTTVTTDSFLADLVNCSLTISNDIKTEVVAIPCAIATSFTPESDIKDTSINKNTNDTTKCTVTVLTKTGKEYMTTIPCSILLNSAAENNVTEPPIIENAQSDLSNSTNEAAQVTDVIGNSTVLNEPTALKLTGTDNVTYSNLNCTPVAEETRDPINPCYSINHTLTVIPLAPTNVPD
ncbi:unnamed protein product [Arctia plantaginis]|uniref:Uncharacterized protein n=1 Tax=Arctia plantaginis TaxID=874455 RepID=A0A8S0YZE8_ARCPL|nr:unnamed protein product [Arctia plantaginis]